jgi:dipeptidase
VYLPLYREGTTPAALASGGADPSPESPWWRMRALLTAVEQDFAARGPLVRSCWDGVETRLADEAAAHEAEAMRQRRAGRDHQAARDLTAFMDRSVRDCVAEAERIVRELGG